MTNKDINARARLFHDTYAKAPPPRSKDENFQAVTKIGDEVLAAMREHNIADTKVGVGSRFEGTNIPKVADHDILFVRNDPDVKVKQKPTPPGYVHLENNGEEISARECKASAKEQVQKTCGANYKVSQHGPAIQVSDKKLSIDVVPTVQTKDGQSYVAKVPKTNESGKSVGEEMWYESHSKDAREKFETIDKGNLCHRETYRTVKAVVQREPNLHPVTSYQIKSAVFEQSDKTDNSKWSRDQLGNRTQDAMKDVADKYRSGEMKDYYVPENNLLANTKEAQRTNIANRLDRLADNPDKLFEMK